MSLSEIWIQHSRNLQEQTLRGFARLNWLFGDNGSGKTSFLEALYLVGNGRSFRTSAIERMICDGCEAVSVSAELRKQEVSVRVGIRRLRDGGTTIRIDGQDEKRLSSLVSVLPVQALTPESYLLLEGSPRERRRFLDWIVFHVEHEYAGLSLRYSRLLQQRNALLRQTTTLKELDVWDKQLAEAGEALEVVRRRCWFRFLDCLRPELQGLQLPFELGIDYYRGWPQDHTALYDCLRAQRDSDFQRAATGSGPHKADIRVRAGRISACDKLSRGQSKVVVQALYIAQLKMLMDRGKSESILLLDDMGAELDQQKQQGLLDQALALPGVQVFVTSTLRCPEAIRKRYNAAMFHVEHGVISPVLPDQE